MSEREQPDTTADEPADGEGDATTTEGTDQPEAADAGAEEGDATAPDDAR